jgi:hypothetical protein
MDRSGDNPANATVADRSTTVNVPPPKPQPNLLTFWIPLLGIVAIFGYLLAYHFHHERQDNERHLGDFATFYQAAQFAREGRDIYTAGNTAQKYVYPPLVAFLYTPLTRLSRLHAAEVALFVGAAILLGSLLLIARATTQRLGSGNWPPLVLVAFIVAMLNENELRLQLTMLETDSLMLLMFALALWWLDRRPALAGLALAFAFNIKYLPIVILPYLILRRRWKATAAMILGSIFFALLPAVLLGWREDVRCLRVSFGGLLKWVGLRPDNAGPIDIHGISDNLSLSITSALGRALAHFGFSSAAIMLAAGGVGLLALAAVAWMYRAHGLSLWTSPSRKARSEQPWVALVALEWAGLITVALTFSPDTNARHLLLAVIVNAVGVVLLLCARPSRRLPLAIALLVIFLTAIMPVHSWRGAFFRYGIPGFGLLAGYLVILWAGLEQDRRPNVA